LSKFADLFRQKRAILQNDFGKNRHVDFGRDFLLFYGLLDD